MPADDPAFLRISQAQWLWYGAQVAADEEEKFELLRDVAEHNAMFWNPQGVDQVRQSREQTFRTDPEEFGSVLEELFGRKPDLPDQPQPSHQHSGSFMDILRNEVPHEEKPAPSRVRQEDAHAYLDMELDEIHFTPAE